MATMNISLPDKMKEWVESQTTDGRYSNASDYVRDLIRHDQEKRRKIAGTKVAIPEGIVSGNDQPFNAEDFRAEMHEQHGHKFPTEDMP